MAPRRRTIAGLAGAAGLAAAGVLAQRRLLHAIAADPERERLNRPLGGERIPVRAADGTELHVEAFGPAEAPKLVLVHGWMCALRFWRYQIDELAGEFRVIAYDMRGHARSGAAEDYSFGAFAGDLDAVLAEGERALVAGHSMGAMTIAAWAGEHPAEVPRRLSGAMLLNTGLGDLITESVVLRAPARLEGLQDPLGRLVMTAELPLPAAPSPIGDAAVRYIAMSPGASPARVAFCREMVLSCNPRVRGACGHTMSRMDLWSALESLDVPTIVLAGEVDKLTPPSLSHRLAHTLPNLHSFVELPGVGHMGAIEAPERVNSHLRDLASSTSATQAVRREPTPV